MSAMALAAPRPVAAVPPLAVALAAGAGLLAIVTAALTGDVPEAVEATPVAVAIGLALAFVATAAIGALIVRRADGHPVGWLLLVAGVLFGAGLGAEDLAKWRAADGHLDGWAQWSSWFDAWAWTGALGLAVIALALFPHRRPTGPARAALVAGMALASAARVAAAAVAPGELSGGSHQTNPLGAAGLGNVTDGVEVVAGAAFSLGVVLTAAALVGRYRSVGEEERQQLRWLALAVAAVVGTGVLAGLAALVGIGLAAVPFLVAVVGIPAAMAVAVLRDHLWDIDVVVNRLILSTLLVAAITVAYVAVAAVTTLLVGDTSDATAASTIVTLVAVSVVALPARDRLQRTADRIVFGRRSTPYGALADFAEHAVAAWSTQETAPRLAELLEAATGARAAVVYVRLDDELVPHDGSGPVGLDAPLGDRFDLVTMVERHGEVLGAIALSMAPGVPVRPAERRLVEHLAAPAALTFETLRLTAELARHADDLRRSRLRLVEAQDAERRRIGRDLHDGAQQQLVAIIGKAGLARAQLGADGGRAGATLLELQDDARGALHDLRELVHGVFPQALVDHGLAAAIESRTSRLQLDVVVDAGEATSAARFPAPVESAAWFVVAEALTNAVKHAGAGRATVRLHHGESLVVEVADDGVGIRPDASGAGLTNMADRVTAIGGELHVGPGPGCGTVVRCSLPLDGAVQP
jgi:signal transduction histidine kinase